MTIEEMLHMLYERHGEDFPWFMISLTNRSFTDELMRELQSNDPLFLDGRKVRSVIKCESNDDVLFFIGSVDGQDIYRIYHLTYMANNMPGWPRYVEFVGLEAVMEYIESNYLLAEIEDYNFLWTSEIDDWVLIGAAPDYTIFNRKTSSMMLVEDDMIAEALVDRMREHGCKVYESIHDCESAESDQMAPLTCDACRTEKI